MNERTLKVVLHSWALLARQMIGDNPNPVSRVQWMERSRGSRV
jgi:hypothetical protein